MQEFKIIMNDNAWHTRRGEIVDGFGVHCEDSNRWHVTHLPSGALVGAAFTRKEARERARVLGQVSVAGVPLASLPGCEACADVLVLVEHVGKVLNREIDPERAMKSAVRLSNALACSKEVVTDAPTA